MIQDRISVFLGHVRCVVHRQPYACIRLTGHRRTLFCTRLGRRAGAVLRRSHLELRMDRYRAQGRMADEAVCEVNEIKLGEANAYLIGCPGRYVYGLA